MFRKKKANKPKTCFTQFFFFIQKTKIKLMQKFDIRIKWFFFPIYLYISIDTKSDYIISIEFVIQINMFLNKKKIVRECNIIWMHFLFEHLTIHAYEFWQMETTTTTNQKRKKQETYRTIIVKVENSNWINSIHRNVTMDEF